MSSRFVPGSRIKLTQEAAISPDGKRVAFFRGGTEREAVLLRKTENK